MLTVQLHTAQHVLILMESVALAEVLESTLLYLADQFHFLIQKMARLIVSDRDALINVYLFVKKLQIVR